MDGMIIRMEKLTVAADERQRTSIGRVIGHWSEASREWALDRDALQPSAYLAA